MSGRSAEWLASRRGRLAGGRGGRRLVQAARLLLCLAIASACTSTQIRCNCPSEQASGVQISMFPWLHAHPVATNATACVLKRCSTTPLKEGNNDAFVPLSNDVTAATNVTVSITGADERPILVRNIRVRPELLTYSCCGGTTHSSVAQLTLEGNGTLADTTVRAS